MYHYGFTNDYTYFTSPNSKLTELRKDHDELKSQFDMLVKQVEAMNLHPRVDVVIDKPITDEPKAPKADKAPKTQAIQERNTPSFALPWTVTPITGCQGIRSNYDTYAQCHQPCTKDMLLPKHVLKTADLMVFPKMATSILETTSPRKLNLTFTS